MTPKSTDQGSSRKAGTGSLAVVWTTLSDAEAADRIAGELVQRRLAACVQIDGPVRSIYIWKGEKHVDDEYQLAIKTASDRVADVIDWLAQNHPYEEPEILVTPVTETSPGYLRWAVAQTR